MPIQIAVDKQPLFRIIDARSSRSDTAIESRKRFRADMVLNALRIHFRHSLRDAYGTKKSHYGLMAPLGGGSQFAAFIREKNGPVWLGGYKSPLLQPGDRAINGYMSDPESFGEVHHARLSHFRNQIRDRLHIIFRGLIGVLAPGLRQVFRLEFCVEAVGRRAV
jgi:hypothetical protein